MSDIIAQNPVKRDRHISDKLNPADFSSGKIIKNTVYTFTTSHISHFCHLPLLLPNFSLFFSLNIYGIWAKLIWLYSRTHCISEYFCNSVCINTPRALPPLLSLCMTTLGAFLDHLTGVVWSYIHRVHTRLLSLKIKLTSFFSI